MGGVQSTESRRKNPTSKNLCLRHLITKVLLRLSSRRRGAPDRIRTRRFSVQLRSLFRVKEVDSARLIDRSKVWQVRRCYRDTHVIGTRTAKPSRKRRYCRRYHPPPSLKYRMIIKVLGGFVVSSSGTSGRRKCRGHSLQVTEKKNCLPRSWPMAAFKCAGYLNCNSKCCHRW